MVAGGGDGLVAAVMRDGAAVTADLGGHRRHRLLGSLWLGWGKISLKLALRGCSWVSIGVSGKV